jgi:PAS domain S-box-containing protein
MSWTAINKGGKWYASGRDTTFQKQLIDETRQLSLVASKIKNGVVISNVNDKVVWANDAFETITGYNLTDVEGKFLGEVLKGKPKDAEAEKTLIEAIKNNQPYEVELSMNKQGWPPVMDIWLPTLLFTPPTAVWKNISASSPDITARKKPSRMWRYYHLPRANRQAAL